MQTLSEHNHVHLGFRSDVGRKRKQNEDSFAALQHDDLEGRLDGLFLVADGMGGMGGGDVASRIAVQSVTETIRAHLQQEETIDAAALLQASASAANSAVRAKREDQLTLRSMGSTLTCGILQGDTLTLGHIGDSRAYLLRQTRLRMLTNDHSPVWMEVQAGRMTREEAQQSRYRSSILRAVGIEPEVHADIITTVLEPGDTLLLCSDGLTTEVHETEIARILATAPDPQSACDRLIAAALREGGSDNITAIVARYGELSGEKALEEEDTPSESNMSPHSPSQLADSTPARSLNILSLFLVGVCFLQAATIAYLLLHTDSNRAAPSQHIVQPKASAPPITAAPTAYAHRVEIVSKTPLRSSFLYLLPGGDIAVVSKQNHLIEFSPNGLRQNRLMNDLIPPDQKLRRGTKKQQAAFAIAFDRDGNRYQIQPITDCIEKYTPEGTRISSDIGKGQLTSPTAIAVSSTGDIYVIDNDELKLIRADSNSASPTGN